jgi:hypothetical protein
MDSTSNKIPNSIKISIIDDIISLYPNLKREREFIINHLLKGGEKPNTYILEKFYYNNRPYYRDEEGIILDPDIKLAGFYKYDTNNNIIYYFNFECNTDLSEYNEKLKIYFDQEKNSKNKIKKQKSIKLIEWSG